MSATILEMGLALLISLLSVSIALLISIVSHPAETHTLIDYAVATGVGVSIGIMALSVIMGWRNNGTRS